MSCKSMTGFGQAVSDDNELSLKVEIRTVNHRFAEYNIRLQRELAVLEEAVRKKLAQTILRGRVDVYISFEADTLKKQVKVDWDVLDACLRAEEEARLRFGRANLPSLSLDAWLKHEGVIAISPVPIQVEQVRGKLLATLDRALQGVLNMREREGTRIQMDLTGKLDALDAISQEIQSCDSKAATLHRERLLKKIQDLGLDLDPARLLTEVALIVDRAAVDEEVVRLKSHIAEFRRTLTSTGSIGRRLDFIVQEMHREVNTIGSKSVDLHISKAVVDAKVIVEQLREQAQNIE